MLPALIVLLVLLYALSVSDKPRKRQQNIEKKVNPKYSAHIETHQEDHWKEELDRLQTVQYAKTYIINVINHGSDQFGFPGGEMEGGFASANDAPRIACYVLELSGKKCSSPYEKDAAMFYSSNCAGCHGEDGTGLNGTYPDLTRKKLLGIEKREAVLKNLMTKMK